ncbi:fimbrial protein, partial [Escherichia coli]
LPRIGQVENMSVEGLFVHGGDLWRLNTPLSCLQPPQQGKTHKIATLGSGNPRNFTWNIISNNNVVMPTGGCTVDSRNVTVDLPDFPGSAEIPLGVYCSSEQKLSFYLSGATTDSSRQVFANTAPDATKASGVGVTLMRNGKILATGENVSLGTVNKSKVPLGLSATYGQTGNKVSAGTVQSVIGVTFIYE